jgi:hypothetical protein
MASPNRPVNGGDGIKSFDPRILDRSVIAIPLPEEIRKDEQEIHWRENSASRCGTS